MITPVDKDVRDPEAMPQRLNQALALTCIAGRNALLWCPSGLSPPRPFVLARRTLLVTALPVKSRNHNDCSCRSQPVL